MMKSAIVVVLLALIQRVSTFSISRTTRARLPLKAHTNKFQNVVTSAIIASTLALSPLAPPPAIAFEDSDYASETVTAAVDALRNAGSDAAQTFKVFEDIAAIITEGKGVGGSINYQGVQLNRGYIADEDTAIYNPGLSLLTESEKERLVDAVISSRKAGLAAQSWTDDNQVGYDFLKEKLDPLRMTELRGYLGILPFYGAFVYLVVLAVQQTARDFFEPAYVGGVALIALPIIALVAVGPQ